jgi:pimeloyl-ACP methyl ester carboxylesterase
VKSILFKRLIRTLIVCLVLLNVIAFFHAYKFTHYSDDIHKTKTSLSFGEKVKTLFLGVKNPRPQNKEVPKKQFETFYVQNSGKIECWEIKVEKPLGTIALFHGYGASKSKLLDKSTILNELGYNTVLVDFMGSGGSDGIQTTIGFKEAEQVIAVFEFLSNRTNDEIHLFGTSMGAVAILKALSESTINPKSIILECPFGSMYKTVKNRFDILNIPSFPMAELLMFWGGVQNGFWSFGHQPREYAKSISVPVLLMYGKKDKKVSLKEIEEIYGNLDVHKKLVTFEKAGHNDFLKIYRDDWTSEVDKFISQK